MQMVRLRLLAVILCGLILSSASVAAEREAIRPPAVPLMVVDPYFSVWSPHDYLSDGPTMHWTEKPQPLVSLVSVDGKVYRVIGRDPFYRPPMTQTGLEVTPTRTIYTMENEAIRLRLTFMTPLLPDELDIFARPVTYVTWAFEAIDGTEHHVNLTFEVPALMAVNTPEQKVVWDRPVIEGMQVMRIGSEEQAILGTKGDDVRIDWGHLYVAIADQAGIQMHLGNGESSRGAILTGNPLPAQDEPTPRVANMGTAAAMLLLDVGMVGTEAVSRTVLVAYDDIYSIEYMGEQLRPYWRRNGMEPAELLLSAQRDFDSLRERCVAFDKEFKADLESLGGKRYAEIGALAYRQCMAAGKLAADREGKALYFNKECFSNACISTVDVIYPASPQFLLFSPALLKAQLEPVLAYASSPRWKFPFAPHDLGTYPKANGQVYGGGEETEVNQMPVEETGNMLLMLAGLAQAEGNADFAARHWSVVEKWADYLVQTGWDPQEQLCTDDFAGHLAHNVNLSAKAILALGGYAELCAMLEKPEQAKAARAKAEEFAKHWVEAADDGDHYRLAFDKPGTWSQKYNLVWDRVLGLALFPKEVAEKETAWYRKTQMRYGIALDNREKWTKGDWVFWSASLTGKREDFEALIAPVYDFMNETPNRVPMTDWYWANTGRIALFQARPVVGGVMVNVVGDAKLWKKWAAKAEKVANEWAPMPVRQERGEAN